MLGWKYISAKRRASVIFLRVTFLVRKFYILFISKPRFKTCSEDFYTWAAIVIIIIIVVVVVVKILTKLN